MPHSRVLSWSLHCALRAALTASLFASASCDGGASRAGSAARADSRAGPNATRPDKYRMSSSGLDRIRESESFIAQSYDDGVGNQTIGYGHMVLPGESFTGGISEVQGRELFAADVSRIVDPAMDRVTTPLTQNQVDALGSFIYNVGPGNFARSVLPALNAGDYAGATAEMAQYSKGRNQRTGELAALRGLVQRRREEIALFNAPAGTTALLSSGAPWSRTVGRLFATVGPSSSVERLCFLDV
jgi:lysozyme